jgi:hypothetical protein
MPGGILPSCWDGGCVVPPAMTGGVNILEFISSKVIILELLAFVAYEVLYLTSRGSFR